VNLLQAAVEALLFFHPAVWWVSAQMRTERECCCDDAAVKACGDLRLYLSALSDAERRRSGSKLAVALSGASLLHRIRRLTEMRTFESNPWKTWSTAVSASAVLVIFSAASTLLAFVPVQAEPVPGQTTPREVNAKMPKPKSVVSSRQVSEKASAPISQPSTVTTSEVQKPPGAELERLKTQPADLSARYNSSHPDVMALESMAAGKERDSAAGNPQQAKITGTVLDPTGGVIPGATILILAGQTGELLGTTVSGANGSFEIVPPSGNYYIQFAAPGFQTQVFYNPQLGASPLMVAMELGVVREMVTVMTAAPATASTRVSPEPVKVEPLRVGGNVVPPRLVQRADPVYPPEARDANVEGPVVVSALIDAEGNVIAPVVLSGHLLLRNAAVACVQQWHYDPALLDAEPRPVRLSITIIFKLQR
jgi:TonB family protein